MLGEDSEIVKFSSYFEFGFFLELASGWGKRILGRICIAPATLQPIVWPSMSHRRSPALVYFGSEFKMTFRSKNLTSNVQG